MSPSARQSISQSVSQSHGRGGKGPRQRLFPLLWRNQTKSTKYERALGQIHHAIPHIPNVFTPRCTPESLVLCILILSSLFSFLYFPQCPLRHCNLTPAVPRLAFLFPPSHEPHCDPICDRHRSAPPRDGDPPPPCCPPKPSLLAPLPSPPSPPQVFSLASHLSAEWSMGDCRPWFYENEKNLQEEGGGVSDPSQNGGGEGGPTPSILPFP